MCLKAFLSEIALKLLLGLPLTLSTQRRYESTSLPFVEQSSLKRITGIRSRATNGSRPVQSAS